MPGLKGPNSKPTKKKTMSKKKTSNKRPNKMTVPQKRKVWDEINPGADVMIWFSELDKFEIDDDGDISNDNGDQLRRSWLSEIASGAGVYFEANDMWDSEDDCDNYLDYEGDEFEFSPASVTIHAVKIIAPGTTRRIRLDSIGETMVLDTESKEQINIGCQTLSKKDAEKAAVAILEWLDWDVIV